MKRKRLTPPQKLNPAFTAMAIDIFKSGFLVVNKTVIKKLGLVEAIVLSNYVDKYQYWQEKSKNFDGWFYLKHRDIGEELNLTEKMIRRIKNGFVKEGFLKTRMAGSPAKEMIWVDFKKLLGRCFSSALTEEPGLDLTEEPGLYNNNNKHYKNNMFLSKDLGGIVPSNFKTFWSAYPSKRKGSQGKTITAWEKICNPRFKYRPTLKTILTAIQEQKESDQWKHDIIPLATTWLNNKRWLDDAAELKFYDYDKRSNGREEEEDDEQMHSDKFTEYMSPEETKQYLKGKK